MLHVHTGTVHHGWIGCASNIKIHAITAMTSFWLALNIPTSLKLARWHMF